MLPNFWRKRGFWSRRTGLEKALLAALGVCGLAMVAGGSYYAINNNNNSSASGEEEMMKAGDLFSTWTENFILDIEDCKIISLFYV